MPVISDSPRLANAYFAFGHGHLGLSFGAITGRLIAETKVGPYTAVVPTLSGRAWIYAMTSYVIPPDDPFPEGFTVGDIW